ncbi:MAG: hypothetical protein H9536_05190 [Aphanizomenon flos-aquae Clear-A1]|jgi:hypothetical protein|nr:hypothetical protein [Aphanizomenon flos-aquae Clear-A1]
MLRIFSTHRLFGFLLVGLMITSCGGGTSSNTPSTTSQTTSQDGPQDRGQTPPPTPPPTLTVSVPSLGTSYTVTESTTTADINTVAMEGVNECLNRFGISQRNTTCQAEVRAAASQARNFILR